MEVLGLVAATAHRKNADIVRMGRKNVHFVVEKDIDKLAEMRKTDIYYSDYERVGGILCPLLSL